MTTRKIFGTDGIRGTANAWPVTPEMAMRLGMAAATYFRKSDPRRHLVVIGKDTRLSGYMLEPDSQGTVSFFGASLKTQVAADDFSFIGSPSAETALATAAYIVGVALYRSPWSWLAAA